jgi:hypothetical protein
MKTIRNLIAVGIGMLALMAMSPAAKADAGYQSFGCTNTVRSNTTVSVNLGSGIKIDNQDSAGLTITGTGDAAGSSGAVTITFARSYDGTNWETHPKFTAATAVNGTTFVLEYTNLPNTVVGSAIYIKPTSIVSADTGANFTNFDVGLTKKNTKRAN